MHFFKYICIDNAIVVYQKKNILKLTVWFNYADWHKTQTKYRSNSAPIIGNISLISHVGNNGFYKLQN